MTNAKSYSEFGVHTQTQAPPTTCHGTSKHTNDFKVPISITLRTRLMKSDNK